MLATILLVELPEVAHGAGHVREDVGPRVDVAARVHLRDGVLEDLRREVPVLMKLEGY